MAWHRLRTGLEQVRDPGLPRLPILALVKAAEHDGVEVPPFPDRLEHRLDVREPEGALEVEPQDRTRVVGTPDGGLARVDDRGRDVDLPRRQLGHQQDLLFLGGPVKRGNRATLA